MRPLRSVRRAPRRPAPRDEAASGLGLRRAACRIECGIWRLPNEKRLAQCPAPRSRRPCSRRPLADSLADCRAILSSQTAILCPARATVAAEWLCAPANETQGAFQRSGKTLGPRRVCRLDVRTFRLMIAAPTLPAAPPNPAVRTANSRSQETAASAAGSRHGKLYAPSETRSRTIDRQIEREFAISAPNSSRYMH